MTRRVEKPSRVVRIPADVDRDDQVLAGFSARQVLILAAAALLGWLVWTAARPLAGPLALAAVVPVAAAGFVLAVGSRDGLTLDRFAIAAIRHVGSAKRLVTAPSGTSRAPDWLDPSLTRAVKVSGPAPVPLRLPVRAVHPDGLLDLGVQGWAAVLEATTVNLALRSTGEQEALVAGLARWLNGLSGPVQVLVRAVPLDLAPAVHDLELAATRLPDAALEAAALDYTGFLADLASDRELLARQILLVLRETASGRAGAARVRQHAADTVTALAAAGITASVLDGATLAAVLDDVAGSPW